MSTKTDEDIILDQDTHSLLVISAVHVHYKHFLGPSKDALKTMLQNFNAEEEIPPPPQIPAPPVPNAKGGENMDIDEGTTLGKMFLYVPCSILKC